MSKYEKEVETNFLNPCSHFELWFLKPHLNFILLSD
jgi:hypothetical protein